jgi:hypothetical protein
MRLGIFVAVCLVALVLGLWLRAVNAPEWLQRDTTQTPSVLRPWAVEADCYSQLARVQRILHGDGLIQSHFKVENWPEGLVPSTTAPFDYAILLLYFPLWLVTKYPLDWAGALVSPALWTALVVFWMIFRSREFNLVGRALLIFGSAVLPVLVWATACGRPRHQSLILALLAVALTAEYERWHIELAHKRAWNIAAGVVWGFACWTSLFEPLLLFVLLVAYNFIVRRRESPGFLISYGVVMLVALALEGVHIFIPPPEYRDAMWRWLGTIGEVNGMGLMEFLLKLTPMIFFLPLIGGRLLSREGDRRTDWFIILATLLLTVIAALQNRWVYYAALGGLFIVVRYCQAEPWRWSRALAIFLFVTAASYSDYVQVTGAAQVPPNLPSPALAAVARSIDKSGGIMAPWWLSPSLLYFSGQPIVSGSSHCGISGIVDSAKFFSSTSWPEAEQILRERKVAWIVVYDDDPPEYVPIYPVLNNSRAILGLAPYAEGPNPGAGLTVWRTLVNDQTDYMPRDLRLRAVVGTFKLYAYEPELGP